MVNALSESGNEWLHRVPAMSVSYRYSDCSLQLYTWQTSLYPTWRRKSETYWMSVWRVM